MKHFFKSAFVVLASGLFMISCNSENGDNDKTGDHDSADARSDANKLDNDDADFLSFAAYSGMKEIEEGKAAQSKGQAKEVKELGKHMVDEHTAMGEKVKALAAKKNVQLKDSLDAEDMDKIRNNKKTGKDFDRDYVSEIVDDHEKAVKRFEDAASDAKDPEIKALANEALPKLRHHLEMSKAIKDKMKD